MGAAMYETLPVPQFKYPDVCTVNFVYVPELNAVHINLVENSTNNTLVQLCYYPAYGILNVDSFFYEVDSRDARELMRKKSRSLAHAAMEWIREVMIALDIKKSTLDNVSKIKMADGTIAEGKAYNMQDVDQNMQRLLRFEPVARAAKAAAENQARHGYYGAFGYKAQDPGGDFLLFEDDPHRMPVFRTAFLDAATSFPTL